MKYLLMPRLSLNSFPSSQTRPPLPARSAAAESGGLVVHKLLEEVLTGETADHAEVLEIRARVLLSQLGLSEAARPENGPHAPELAATTLRALAIPEIVACRSRLVPEMTVFSAQADDHRAIYVGGIADAVAYQPEGSVDLVIDWKTDVNPTTQQIDLYREQMHDYLTALAAPEGLLVFVTSGQLVHVRAFQPSAGAA
jgi:ATP-dependent exoDNAse (exonuclease V) beta subunit